MLIPSITEKSSVSTLGAATSPTASILGRRDDVPSVPDIPLQYRQRKNAADDAADEDPAASATLPVVTSAGRASVLLVIFCVAQFLDNFSNSALLPPLGVISSELDMDASEQQWLFSAYQLTFAAFLLLSGRIADISSPKWTFIVGLSIISVITLGLGFVRVAIAVLVLRAVQGVGAALTVPSAYSLIVCFFPSQPGQGRAIALFGASGCIGNVAGLLIGAAFAEYVSYKWCFWFVACAAAPAAVASVILIPPGSNSRPKPAISSNVDETKRGSLDYVGVGLLTSTMILFVFGLTSGASVGWGTAQVWAPIVVSLITLVSFLYWETRIPEEHAALPSAMWFYPNFAALFSLALVPYAWWMAIFLLFSQLWPQYGLSTIEIADHFLPVGITAGVVLVIISLIPPYPRPKRVIMSGFVFVLAASGLLAFARGMEHYWSLAFPGMILGSTGCGLIYVYTNIGIFQATPPSRAGVTGAVFNSGSQLGNMLSAAIVTSITTSVNERLPNDPYNGVSASFWFMFGIEALEAVTTMFFYRQEDPSPRSAED